MGVWNLVAAGGTKYDRNFYNQAEVTLIDNKENVFWSYMVLFLFFYGSQLMSFANQKLLSNIIDPQFKFKNVFKLAMCILKIIT